MVRRFCPNPVYVIIDVRPGVEGIPTTAYMTTEEVEADGKEIQKTFKHLPSSVGERAVPRAVGWRASARSRGDFQSNYMRVDRWTCLVLGLSA